MIECFETLDELDPDTSGRSLTDAMIKTVRSSQQVLSVPLSVVTRQVWSLTGRALVGCLTLVVFLTLLTGCCTPQRLRNIKDTDDFMQHVVMSEKPVLVEFYKGGCPTCVILNPLLETLAREYDCRIEFARFELVTPVFTVTSPEIMELYHVNFFPTIILFTNGQEQKRWTLEYDINSYRRKLNEIADANGQDCRNTRQ